LACSVTISYAYPNVMASADEASSAVAEPSAINHSI